MRLDVGVLGAEERLGALEGELLDDVDVLAAAVVALARVALGVLVGEPGALGFHHRGEGEVLAGDQLDLPRLPVALASIAVHSSGSTSAIDAHPRSAPAVTVIRHSSGSAASPLSVPGGASEHGSAPGA